MNAFNKETRQLICPKAEGRSVSRNVGPVWLGPMRRGLRERATKRVRPCKTSYLAFIQEKQKATADF